ncbi:SET and MYND domain-containing protein DDB_G0284059-like [Microplitis mediator]|uniref:SET and MYND domain-containing protein DDB_G0284059-like n=1 Tax=Microplitis mediator TaxID=375433 RepID=UPI002552B141|nr:SET and MYND domain-containing protein DDB_G0284059-like [Microplitis mediator]
MDGEKLARKIESFIFRESTDDSYYENLIEDAIQETIKEGEISIKHESKNKEIASQKIDLGNKVVSIAPLNELIEIYSGAIAYALPDSELLARGFANRSAVLANFGMYEDSLKDIERALEIGYPDSLKAKLYARKAKNLLALNPKMCPEVNDSITQAKIWVEKMDEDNKKKVENSLDQLKMKSFKEPVKKWDDSLFLPKMTNDNPKILRASSAIDIRQSEKVGRHIVATKNIKAGKAIMTHKAYSAVLMNKYWHTYCWNCLKFTWSCVPCSQCANVVYCNEKCRDDAWQEHHDIECPVINALVAIDKEMIEMSLMSLRILVKAIKEFRTVEALSNKVQEIDQIDDSITKCFTQGVFDDTKYASVYALLRIKFEVWKSIFYTRKAIKILFILAATTDIFNKKIVEISELRNINFGNFIGKLLFQHMEIATTNSIAIMPNDNKGNTVKVGSVLLPLLSLCSHSCDCNVYQYASGNINAVIALQPIKKGEQICISYGSYYRDAPTSQRRQILMEKNHFWCECIPCSNNWNPQYRPPSCLAQPVAIKNMNKLLQNMKKYNEYPPIVQSYQISTRDKSPRDILKTISGLFELLNTYDKYVNYCAEVEHAKNLLLNIYMWIAGY